MRLIFLGTSSVYPTKERNHQSVALKYGGEIILFDCGEGTQRQMRIAKLKLSKLSKILISHWHGDHVLGLPGLLQSCAMDNRVEPLEIWGPPSTKEKIKYIQKTYDLILPFKLIIHEVKNKKTQIVGEEIKYEIFAASLTHPCECLGFSFKEKDKIKINTDYLKKIGLTKDPILKKLQQCKNINWNNNKIKAKDATFIEKGKKITYIVDTSENENIIELARNSDVLICESTYLNELKNQAKERGHLTAKQAGSIAKKANVRKLILTHFSQRYPKLTPLINEAKSKFKNTSAAKDFMEVVIEEIASSI